MPTVLVVDDDPEVCHLLVTFLEFTGFTVLTACDGRDALYQLACAVTVPAVILLDLMGADHGRHRVPVTPAARHTIPRHPHRLPVRAS